EVGVVEDVQELRLDVQANVLPDGEVLGDREVRVNEMRTEKEDELAKLVRRCGRRDQLTDLRGVYQKHGVAGIGLLKAAVEFLLQGVHVVAVQVDTRIGDGSGVNVC